MGWRTSQAVILISLLTVVVSTVTLAGPNARPCPKV